MSADLAWLHSTFGGRWSVRVYFPHILFMLNTTLNVDTGRWSVCIEKHTCGMTLPVENFYTRCTFDEMTSWLVQWEQDTKNRCESSTTRPPSVEEEAECTRW